MNLGRLNFRLTRVQGHMAKVQWAMVLYLFMDSLKTRYHVSFWWGLLILPALYLVHRVDKGKIYGPESNAAAEAIPWNRLLMQKVDTILERLK